MFTKIRFLPRRIAQVSTNEDRRFVGDLLANKEVFLKNGPKIEDDPLRLLSL